MVVIFNWSQIVDGLEYLTPKYLDSIQMVSGGIQKLKCSTQEVVLRNICGLLAAVEDYIAWNFIPSQGRNFQKEMNPIYC